MTSRHIDLGGRKSGPCKVIYHNPAFDTQEPMTLTDVVKGQILSEKNRQACAAIDKDWSHCRGFSANMRHARR